MTENNSQDEALNGAEESIPLQDDPLQAAQKEAQECKEKYLRLLAESENMRKRLQREKQEMTTYAIEQVVVEFLQPMDHMESALLHTEKMSEEVKHWGLGFQMILTQFKDVLAMNGVQPFDSKGKKFDTHFHEAVETDESSKSPPGIVVEEFTKGYKMGDKVIRPARVKVSKTPQKNEDEVKV